MSTTKKMGEAQIIDFFSGSLREELISKFGSEASYSLGNFSGSQDRKFADFFAGTHSSCMLIEFKEFENEVQDEHGKPLREKLCRALTIETAQQSRGSHFIAWGEYKSDIQVTLAPYVDMVCRKFTGEPPLQALIRTDHSTFIDRFLAGDEGVPLDAFTKYAGHLNRIAGGIEDGRFASFKSILYSRNSRGKVIGTRFENLGQLKELIDRKPKKTPRPGI